MREILLLSYHNIISSLVCSIMTMITIVFFVGMTVEEAYFSGAMITVLLMYSRNRKSTLITSRYLRSFINVAIEPGIHWCSVFRWRTNAVSAMTRPDASSSPAMQLTRWTRYPASSATTRWSSLRGEKKHFAESFLFHKSFARYPLIDGTFFISPKQHTAASIQVRIAAIVQY